MLPKVPKGRTSLRRYAKRVRELKKTRKRKKTPWKSFFDSGIGATIRTEIPIASIRSTVYSYGKARGKIFKCSYSEREDSMLVRIEAVKRRK